MPLNKTPNQYADVLDQKLYAACPKAVFAAIAVSYASAGGDHLNLANENIIREWWTLFDNGIVPQKPPIARAVAEGK